MNELKAKIREYSYLAASLSSQARAIPLELKENRKRKIELMRQATEAGRQCQALIQELKRQQST